MIGQARTAFEHWQNRGDSEQQRLSRSYDRGQWEIKLIQVVQFEYLGVTLSVTGGSEKADGGRVNSIWNTKISSQRSDM